MFRDFIRRWMKSGPEGFVSTAEICHPNAVQSRQGRYFVGRTGLFRVASKHEALVLFHMPPDRSARAFVVTITVTSNRGRRAFFYFGAQTPVPMQDSLKLANVHRGAPFAPHSTIQMASAPKVPLSAGVAVFERLLVGGDTLVTEQEGHMILEPGEAFGVRFEPMEGDDEIDVAFGWWEEPA